LKQLPYDAIIFLASNDTLLIMLTIDGIKYYYYCEYMEDFFTAKAV